MAEKTLQQKMDELFNNMKTEQAAAKILLSETYNPKIDNAIRRYFYSAENVPLISLCNPETTNFLFLNNSEPFISIDESSMVRKQIYNDQVLFCSYYFAEPITDFSFMPQISTDITVSKKPISDQLKSTLEDLHFFADALIDFETFEFPYYADESYYGSQYSDRIKKICQDHSRKNKDISSLFRKGNTPIYRDTEKIHLQFAAGKGVDGRLRFIPVYVGIGTNEPSNLSFSGQLGKSRFIKYKFDTKESGIELGTLVEKPISIEDFNKKFAGMTLNDICWGKDWKICDIIDEEHNPEYVQSDDYCLDAERMKGFVKIYSPKGKEQKGFEVFPEYKFTNVNQQKYLESVLRYGPADANIIRNSADILNLLDKKLAEYDAFASVQFHPQHIVKTFGMEEVFKKVCFKLDKGDFQYADALNIASDVYTLGTDSFERLKISSLILGNYIISGKFDELLKNTYEGKKTCHL